MENENVENILEGVWVVAIGFGQSRFLGRAYRIDGKPAPTGTVEEVRTEFKESGFVTLNPAFEVIAPLIPKPVRGPSGEPGMALTRDNIVIYPSDFTFQAAPIDLKPNGLLYIPLMEKEDQDTYKGFAEQGFALMLQTRAKRAGLALPGDAGGRS